MFSLKLRFENFKNEIETPIFVLKYTIIINFIYRNRFNQICLKALIIVHMYKYIKSKDIFISKIYFSIFLFDFIY